MWFFSWGSLLSDKPRLLLAVPLFPGVLFTPPAEALEFAFFGKDAITIGTGPKAVATVIPRVVGIVQELSKFMKFVPTPALSLQGEGTLAIGGPNRRK